MMPLQGRCGIAADDGIITQCPEAAKYLYRYKGLLEEASERCNEVLHVAPKNAWAHYLRASIELQAGRVEEATRYACKAAHLRPDLPMLKSGAGSLLMKTKDYEGALAQYEAAIEIDPSNASFHLGAASALRKLGRAEEALASFERAGEADPLDARVQYKLGQHLRSVGALPSAVEAFRRALELDPSHALSSFWLCATRASEVPEVLRGRKLGDGGDSEDDEETVVSPSAAPREYVVALYNSYAETFDSHLLGALAYQTPTIMVDNLRSLFPNRRWRRCLDLGCGTGLSGQAMAPLCQRLVGVDLSAAMLIQARRKRVYHRLLEGDVTDRVLQVAGEREAGFDWSEPGDESQRGGGCLSVDAPVEVGESRAAQSGGDEEEEVDRLGWERECDASSGLGTGCRGDLVVSCDVFGYVGDLSACFAAVRRLLWSRENKAVFAFSVEASPRAGSPERRVAVGGMDSDLHHEETGEGERGYELQGTGRFTHSMGYVRRTCQEAGFRVIEATRVVLRKNAGIPVSGIVMVTESMGDR